MTSKDYKDYDGVNKCYKMYVESYVILIENEPMIILEPE
jgi:hypothetical protein